MVNQLDIRILLMEPYDTSMLLYTHQMKNAGMIATEGNYLNKVFESTSLGNIV